MRDLAKDELVEKNFQVINEWNEEKLQGYLDFWRAVDSADYKDALNIMQERGLTDAQIKDAQWRASSMVKKAEFILNTK